MLFTRKKRWTIDTLRKLGHEGVVVTVVFD